MKTILVASALSVVAVIGLAQSNQETAKPETQAPIDPRWQQMQVAVLQMQDIHKVEELINQGVDVNAPIGCGTFNALDGALSTRNLDMLKFLLAHGGKLRGHELTEAAFISNPDKALDMAKVLLSAGVDPNATNYYKATPLGHAAYRENRDLVALLLSQPGIKVDAADTDGYTALMWAAAHGSLEIVDLLVNAGANPRIKNNRGETAARLAEEGIATRRAIISALQPKQN